MTAVAAARSAFLRHYGEQPDGVAFAPGRVNLIGDHVDYCDGLVLPMPLSLGTAVAWRASAGYDIRGVAVDFGDETDSFEPGAVSAAKSGWRTYLRGMAATLGAGARGQGMDLAIAGDLPRGAGLSSSASLCIALGRAMIAGGMVAPIPPSDLARAAQRTEHEFAHVSCGIMDQMAAACGQAGHGMLLDCRDLAWQNLALPAGWAVLIVPSGVTRGLVDGEYNLRRQQCENAARTLGVTSLRDVASEMLASVSMCPVERARATHVTAEIARVRAAATAMAQGDLAVFGRMLNESHASLRDLFAVSHPQVDRLVALLQQAIGTSGGARMTGGGFGGAVVAVVLTGEVGCLRGMISENYSPDAATQMMVVEQS